MPGLTLVERPLELPDHHRIEPPILPAAAANNAAARGRCRHGRLREQPTSKNSTVIRPTPSIARDAVSSCHCREVAGS